MNIRAVQFGTEYNRNDTSGKRDTFYNILIPGTPEKDPSQVFQEGAQAGFQHGQSSVWRKIKTRLFQGVVVTVASFVVSQTPACKKINENLFSPGEKIVPRSRHI